jgi:aminopeptidase N
MKPVFRLFILISSFFIACRSAKNNHRQLRTMDTVSVSAFNNPMNLYRASAPRLWNIIHTRVALSFDYANRTANGEEWLTLQPYFYPTDTLVLDAKSMKIESVSIGHGDKLLKFRYDSTNLFIQLDKIYSKDDLVKLNIKYVAMPYAFKTGGSAAITDDRGLYFINHDGKLEGKPIQIWTQGETEANSHWLPTIDKPNSRTTIQIELTVPAQFKTLSNGELISSADKGIMRTDIWKMDKPIQIYAIMFAIGDFAIAKDTWRNKEVNYYVEPAYAPYARKMFQYTTEMLEFFSNTTGVTYPWNKYSQVVVRDYVSGAMENTSASLFGSFMNQNHREYDDANHEDVVSHELFHQWFGDYVTAESWSNLTVNESFATYGEYLWRKHKYGLNYADELAWSDLQKYLDFTDYSDPVLVRHHYRDKEDMFDRVSYQKGGAILHYLHHLIGDSAFYKSMNVYLTKNALSSAEATHWRLAVEEATGKDWNWFFNDWYYRAGHPILDIQYNYDDAAARLNVVVQQTQNESVGLYTLPIKTLMIKGTERSVLDWNISKKNQTYTYAYVNGIRPVIVPDIEHSLPAVIKENKTNKEWLTQLNACDDYVSQLLAVQKSDFKNLGDANVIAILHKGLDSKIAAIRELTLSKISNIESESFRKQWESDIINLATNDGNHLVRSAAIEIVGKWKIMSQKELLLNALNDSSYLIAGNALNSLSKIDEAEAYLQAKKHLKGRANTDLDENAWSILAKKAKTEDTILLKEMALNKIDQEKRTHLFNDLIAYASNTIQGDAYNLCLKLMGDHIRATENKNYRAYYASLLLKLKEEITVKSKKDNKNVLFHTKKLYLSAKGKEWLVEEQDKNIQAIYLKLQD